jgi:ubiquinone/menaquinone biosynthesis C-methylase UbiE
MSKTKEDIYDNIYGKHTIKYEDSKSLIGYLYKRLSRYEISRCQAISKLLPYKQPRLLDLGCGDGNFIFLVKEKFDECYGIDISPMNIEKAKLKSKDVDYNGKFFFYQLRY